MNRTRMKAALAAGILSIAALTGCTINIGATGDGHMDSGQMDGESMADGDRDSRMTGDLNLSDIMFAQMMIPHHEQAVEMADLTPGAGASPEVQELAMEIAAAQGPEIEQMESMLDRWGVGQMMDHSGHQMAGMVSEADMDRLRSATASISTGSSSSS